MNYNNYSVNFVLLSVLLLCSPAQGLQMENSLLLNLVQSISFLGRLMYLCMLSNLACLSTACLPVPFCPIRREVKLWSLEKLGNLGFNIMFASSVVMACILIKHSYGKFSD